MTRYTCGHQVTGDDHIVRPCGKPAVWRVWFVEAGDRVTMEVCAEHLPDDLLDADYVGATAL